MDLGSGFCLHHPRCYVTDSFFFFQFTLKMEGRNNNPRVSALQSKHSETEQRRRSKINGRFQVFRDLIPENDQKRDKASFLLEVIQYIQFLQEKIQAYEGMH